MKVVECIEKCYDKRIWREGDLRTVQDGEKYSDKHFRVVNENPAKAQPAPKEKLMPMATSIPVYKDEVVASPKNGVDVPDGEPISNPQISEDVPDLHKMPFNDLRKYAKEKGIEGVFKMKRPEIIEALTKGA